MTVYGIKNCDSVKKAILWLKAKGIDYSFHDYKTSGISEEKLKEWCNQVGWEILLNRKGTTWKQLDEEVKAKVKSQSEAIPIMMEKTSIIKRPVIEKNGKILMVGFNEDEYEDKISY
jgi:Spx/MgsR family transcriptional regulator